MQSIPIKNVGESRLVDPFQRQYYYLRLSITDQCNFRCTYCLPDGYQPEANKPSFLTLKETIHFARLHEFDKAHLNWAIFHPNKELLKLFVIQIFHQN